MNEVIKIKDKISKKFIKSGLKGIDAHKKNKPVLAEGIGIVGVLLYFIIIIIKLIYIPINKDIILNLLIIFSSLTSIIISSLIGFLDDVIDLSWKQKIILSGVSSFPIVFTCYIIEKFKFWKIYYMIFYTIFCTNSINILSGINGIEVFQILILSIASITYLLIRKENNYIYIYDNEELIDIKNIKNLRYFSNETIKTLIFPLIIISIVFFKFSYYPSSFFLGDTFCYFSGMVIASGSIIGNYTKEMLMLMGLQVLNTIISIPQLIGILPCPRHRYPTYIAKDDKLIESCFKFKLNNSIIQRLILWVIIKLKILKLEYKENQNICKMGNLTVLNLFLHYIGPTKEKKLANYYFIIQIIWCILVIGIIKKLN